MYLLWCINILRFGIIHFINKSSSYSLLGVCFNDDDAELQTFADALVSAPRRKQKFYHCQ